MRKQLVALSLIIIVIIILYSPTFVKGYTPEFDAMGTVSTIISGDSFNLTSGAVIHLADIKAPDKGQKGYQESIDALASIKNGSYPINFARTEVFLDLDESNKTSSGNDFIAVAYISYNITYYLNVDQYLIENNQFIKIQNNLNDFTPYSWTNCTFKNAIDSGIVNNPSKFEDIRIALMNSYNAQTLTHAGYIVTIILAFATLFSKIGSLTTFYSKGIGHRLSCYMLFSALTILLIYFVNRIIFWAWMGSSVLNVTMTDAGSTMGLTYISGIHLSLVNSFENICSHSVNSLFYVIPSYFYSHFTISFLLIFSLSLLTVVLIELKNKSRRAKIKFILILAKCKLAIIKSKIRK